jgi:hypothetical protein
MEDELGKRKNYALGAAAGAVAGFPMGILVAVAFGTSSYPFFLAFLIPVFRYATRGTIFGAIFIWLRDRIPTRRILTKAIIFSLLVELLVDLIDLGLVTMTWFLFLGAIPLRLDYSLASLGIFLLWGAVFGCLLEHPRLIEQIDVLRP